jgi:hypothetical protein
MTFTRNQNTQTGHANRTYKQTRKQTHVMQPHAHAHARAQNACPKRAPDMRARNAAHPAASRSSRTPRS